MVAIQWHDNRNRKTKDNIHIDNRRKHWKDNIDIKQIYN